MDTGCVACHLDCDRLSPADQKNPPEFYLKAKEPELCMECHSTSGKDLAPAHDNQPLGKSKCTGCHDPHSSDTPKLLLKYPHGPYAAQLCSACHPAPANGKVGLTAANADSLCYHCHTNFEAEMAGAGSRHKLLSQSNRSCMECHDPHAANQEYHLKKPAQELCLSCSNWMGVRWNRRDPAHHHGAGSGEVSPIPAPGVPDRPGLWGQARRSL